MKEINWKSPELYYFSAMLWVTFFMALYSLIPKKIVADMTLIGCFIIVPGVLLKCLPFIKKMFTFATVKELIMVVNFKSPILYYVLAMLWMAFCMALFFIMRENLAVSHMMLAGFFIALPGVLLKTMPFVKKIYTSVSGKIFIAFITSLILPVSYSISLHVIHLALKINPEKFNISASVLSVFFAVFLWVSVFSMLLCVFALIRMHYYFFLDIYPIKLFSKKIEFLRKKDYADLENFSFIFGAIAILYLIFTSQDIMTQNKAWFSERLVDMVVVLESYSKPECKNLKMNDNYIYLDDTYVYVIYSDYLNGGYLFKKVVCQS